MGRPLNKKYFGNPTNAGRTYPALMMSSAWMLGQNAISTLPVYIVKQTGANTYYCSDGTNFGMVKLQSSAPTAPGQGNIQVTPFSSSAEGGATFTFSYKVIGATVAVGGTGYAVNNTLTYPNGVILQVGAVTGGAITSINVQTPGNAALVTPASANAVAPTSTNGGGTGAQLNLNWVLGVASVSGGTNYTAGENVQLIGITAATVPVVHIATVSNTGAPVGLTIVNAGSGITQSASSASGSNAPATSYAFKITNRAVDTFDDHDYTWNCFVTASVAGQANLPFSGTGSEQTTYTSGNELQIISGMPYFSLNYGSVTAKQGQIFATGGESGGLGSQTQAAADVGGATGVYNPSATQRRAPIETRTKRMARLAEEKAAREKEESKGPAEFAEKKNKADINFVTAAETNKAKIPEKTKAEKKVDVKKEETKVEEVKEEEKPSNEGPLAELIKKEEAIEEKHESEGSSDAIHKDENTHIEGDIKFT